MIAPGTIRSVFLLLTFPLLSWSPPQPVEIVRELPLDQVILGDAVRITR